jgi:hypothetical protein
MKPNVMVGKTIASVEFIDKGDDGIHIEFTDGTVLSINERMQAGQIQVIYDGEFLMSDWDLDDDQE